MLHVVYSFAIADRKAVNYMQHYTLPAALTCLFSGS